MLTDKLYSDDFRHERKALVMQYPINVLSAFLQMHAINADLIGTLVG